MNDLQMVGIATVTRKLLFIDFMLLMYTCTYSAENAPSYI